MAVAGTETLLVLLPEGWEAPVSRTPSDFREQWLGPMWTLVRSEGHGNWTFACRLGGRRRSVKRRTRKHFDCPAFVNVRRYGDVLRVSSACWIHNHELSEGFIRSHFRPDKATVERIRSMTRDGSTASEIRLAIPDPIGANMFYEMRRGELRKKRGNGLEDLMQLAEEMKDQWIIHFHFEEQGNKGDRNWALTTFISRRFHECPIAKDIMQMDDVDGTNMNYLHLVNIAFLDENDRMQLLAFGVMRRKTMSVFGMFLQDLNASVGFPRVIIVDRCKAQLAAIQEVVPASKVLFCAVHMERNLVRAFGPNCQAVIEDVRRFVNGDITRDEYVGLLNQYAMEYPKKKRTIQLLLEEIDFYDRTLAVQMRGQFTTNAVEGFHGVLKNRVGVNKLAISAVVKEIGKIAESFIMKSYRAVSELPPVLWRGNRLGKLAVDVLNDQFQKAMSLKEKVMLDSLTEEEANQLNEQCNCMCLSEFGLPCFHVLFARMSECQDPLLQDGDIPPIYFRLTRTYHDHGETAVETIIHNVGEQQFQWTYTNVMARLEPVAAAAPRIPRVRELLGEMWDKLEETDLEQYAGPRTGRHSQSCSLPGQPRKKRARHCSHCHQRGHNSRTCPLLKSVASHSQAREDVHENGRAIEEVSAENGEWEEEEDGEWEEEEDGEWEEEEDGEWEEEEDALKNSDYRNPERFARLSQLNEIQKALYLKYRHVFKYYLFQLAETKEAGNLAQLHGIYFNQLGRVMRAHLDEEDRPVIDLIYRANYGSEIPDELRPHLEKLIDDVCDGSVDLSTWGRTTDYDDDDDDDNDW